MGSHPTLDQEQEQPASEALELDPDDRRHRHAVAHLAVEHPQVRAWPDGNPDLAHQVDHRDWIYDHPHPVPRSRPSGHSTGSTPTSASLPTSTTPTGAKPSETAKPPWPPGSE